jgi:hypothetical protein
MRRLYPSLLFLLASSFAVAQTSSTPPIVLKNLPTATFTRGQIVGIQPGYLGTSNFGCHVGFAASRRATGQIMSAGDSRKPTPTQALHLTLHNPDSPAIESIEVTLYGTSQNGLYLPLDTNATKTVSKTFELHRTPDDASLTEADVRMNLTGSLSWADLISITYADGTTWHATQDFKCRAVPSNLLLVGAK